MSVDTNEFRSSEITCVVGQGSKTPPKVEGMLMHWLRKLVHSQRDPLSQNLLYLSSPFCQNIFCAYCQLCLSSQTQHFYNRRLQLSQRHCVLKSDGLPQVLTAESQASGWLAP